MSAAQSERIPRVVKELDERPTVELSLRSDVLDRLTAVLEIRRPRTE